VPGRSPAGCAVRGREPAHRVNSYRFSNRFGRKTILAGISGMLLASYSCWPCTERAQPGRLVLRGPLAPAGLGNGLVIAPYQDFALGAVPKQNTGTAGGALITAQRIGAAIGIAVIGTALFGGSPGGARPAR
jgi:hypothetical protein